MAVLATSSFLVVAALIALLSKYFVASRRPQGFPPGPPTVPFLGNLPQLPAAKAFLK